MAMPIPPPNITSSSSAAAEGGRVGPVTVGGLNVGPKTDWAWPAAAAAVALAFMLLRGGK